ncbi:Tetratricopeptide TPR_2 [Shewanella denitrificans OS217]|jgi:tol-pal system protein YbgF|uniref:Cell division coordinator CpoB n=1 Tax=Shewanella denitrificans (strain OS217 / ATCC BAA-1090 / DSM 15013) TaxID=318161 RepID=Q12PE4_SHEDO|nr:tol-pal system protein YbgF [Shewanella denitrificans]ABE54682.1 Tetratricopeptide TPR_2 [Shewanella denitrificans OS217]
MRYALIVAAIICGIGTAMAAPAPVDDLYGGSSDERLAKLERILKARQQNDFDMQRRLDTLQNEVLELRGITEQQNYQINQMLQRQRQLYEEIAAVSVKSTTPVSAPSGTSVTTSTSVASNTASNVPVVAESMTSSLDETGSYERAVNLVLKERQYDAAIPAFREFIKQYPDSAYAPNANYWLGQLLYNKSDYESAKQAFSTVVSKYADSSKRADSLVKLGMIAEKSNDNNGARALYNKVLKEYANSASARLAQQQLSALKG